MIITTDAVVLRARRFRDSSKILTLFTREFGRMGVVARGAMQPKSRIAHLLQPMVPISAVIYIKEGRDLQNLAKAETLGRFPRLTGDLGRMAAGLGIVELVDATIHGEEPNIALFDALIDSLGALDQEQSDPITVSLWFMVRLSGILGYALRTDSCGICEEPVELAFETSVSPVAYSLALGAPLCSEHRETAPAWEMPLESYRLLSELGTMSVADAAGLSVSRASGTMLNDALSLFIRHHVEGLRRLNVGGVMRDVLG